MRAREFIVKEARTDEIAPVIAAAGGALARGAGSMLAKGAQALGSNIVKGVGNVAGQIANKVAGATSTASQPNPGEGGVSQAPVGTSTTTQQPQAQAGRPAQTSAVDQSKEQVQQKQQAQQQAQQQKELTTNIDKIAAQLVAMKQDLIKQQQQQPT